MKCKKAPGLDDMTTELFKFMPTVWRKALLEILEDIFNSGQLPLCWRMTKMTALLKPGKPSWQASSYRFIGLQVTALKLLDSMCLHRVRKLVPATRWNQFGFVEGRSAAQHLTC
eukprot:53639-Amphidinium_carterae.1